MIQVINEDTKPMGVSTNPWGAPLVTGLHLNFMPPITNVWAWQFSQFSTHLTIHSSSQYSTLSMKMLYKTLLKHLVKSRLKIFTAFPWSTKPDISSYKVDQACFSLVNPCWLLLITILSFIFVNGFQKDLIPHLPRDWGEAGLVMESDLLALLEDRSNVSSLQLSGFLLLVMMFQGQLRLTF